MDGMFQGCKSLDADCSSWAIADNASFENFNLDAPDVTAPEAATMANAADARDGDDDDDDEPANVTVDTSDDLEDDEYTIHEADL